MLAPLLVRSTRLTLLYICMFHSNVFLNIRPQLILVALETKRHGHGIDGESFVVVNPGEDHRIGKGDRGFVLAESQVQQPP